LAESEPEPDLAVVRGDENTYLHRHPGPADVALLVEVADSTLDRDRADKARIYGQAGVPVYWIVNLVDRQVEVYTSPTGPTGAGYTSRQDLRPGALVPLALPGLALPGVAVAALLP
jgi:Uma2 family endonuclease